MSRPKMSRLLAGAALLAGLVAGAPAVASAEPVTTLAGCVGSSCTGKNPNTLGCGNDVYTVATKVPGTGGPMVELRYSPACQAYWARFESPVDINWRIRVQGRKSDGTYVTYLANGSPKSQPYTLMVGTDLPARACVEDYFGTWHCTAWY